MNRTTLRAAAALALTLGALAGPAHASDVLDHSSSASATGSPFSYDIAITRGSLTAIPGNRSSSPTDAAYALSAPIGETHVMAGVPNLNWSNSDSATGSPFPGRGAASGTMLAGRR